MLGTRIVIVFSAEIASILGFLVIGRQLRQRETRAIRRLGRTCRIVGWLLCLHALLTYGFGFMDVWHLRTVNPQQLEFITIHQTTIKDRPTLTHLAASFRDMRLCYPQDTQVPIPSFMVWERPGYRWYRIRAWEEGQQQAIIIYFGRGYDAARSWPFESYGCSQELVQTLRQLNIDINP